MKQILVLTGKVTIIPPVYLKKGDNEIKVTVNVKNNLLAQLLEVINSK
jgi:hypothetical protein